MGNNKNKNKIYWFIILILVIIIILLLIHGCENHGNDNYLMPTGNVDIFDISVQDECNNHDCSEEDKKRIKEQYPIFNEETDKKKYDQVFVDDKNGDYLVQEHLNVFNNAAFEYRNKIAPGVSNTYQFVAHNSTNMRLNYYFEMFEESEFHINMKYRLKKNNKYIIGDKNNWVNADELKTDFSLIEKRSHDKYSLEWKWFDDDANDTIIGENMNSFYKLSIRFYFEQEEDI